MSSNEYMADYMLQRYHERRKRAIALLGGKCVRCARTQDLEFDHKDPDSKEFDIFSLWSCAEDRFLDELSKCQLLCEKCHSTKSTLERGQTPARGTHGTLSAYRYCHCVLCRAAKSKHSKEYQSKKKLVGVKHCSDVPSF